jgi:hypothetical protein
MKLSDVVRRRAVFAAALGLLAGVALVGCTSSPDPGPTATTPAVAQPATPGPTAGQPEPTTAQPTPRPSAGAASPAAHGCPATGTSVPAGAATAPTVDLDGDGAADTLWLSAGTPRTLGVRTHSGAVFSVEFSSAAPQAARATGQRLADGSAVVLLDTSRAVPLYAVVDCAIVPTHNPQGEQYTFDLGFTGYGTGVACKDLGAGLQLVGLNAISADGTSFDVTRTAINLSAHGTKATNGRLTTPAKGVSVDDPAVAAAHGVSCADAPAPVVEP